MLTNYLRRPWLQFSVQVNVGDSVVWVNQEPLFEGTNYVRSYGGEFESPLLYPDDTFSFTFTNAGFYAYHTGADPAYAPPAGTITVNALTGAPPEVMINVPVEGFVLPSFGGLVQATVSNADNIAEVDYFANGSLIGVATNAVYGIYWPGGQAGSVTLLAKAIDRQGGMTWSPPVNVTVAASSIGVWGSQLLPTGEMLLHYHARVAGIIYLLVYSGEPSFTNRMPVKLVDYPGIWVDEAARLGTPRRFYHIE